MKDLLEQRELLKEFEKGIKVVISDKQEVFFTEQDGIFIGNIELGNGLLINGLIIKKVEKFQIKKHLKNKC